MPFPWSFSRDAARPVAAAVALLATAVFPYAASAQSAQSKSSQAPAHGTRKPASADDPAARRKELAALQAEQRQVAEAEAKLKAEIETLGQDRRKFSQALIDTAGRLRAVETRIAEAETRLEALDGNDRALRERLGTRRAAIAELLAALQRMGRRPPPALLVRPEDALAAVRSAIVLGAVLPEMRVEAEALATELGELVRVRREIAAERAALDADLASLSAERQRMALMIEERQKRQSEAETALDAERRRAQTLARQAQTLKDLLAGLTEGAAAVPPPASTAPRPGLPRDQQRLGPAIAFADARGRLPLPVNGIRLREYGAADGYGGVMRGLSVATRASAQITAPSDAWVVYAGPFRSYGQLLILNAGGGYHILLAGMERISVEVGQFVLTGEPVATMGGGARSASALAIGSSQPVLYIEFRKDGVPVDPGPWWAVTDSEKVRG